jgi:hypothetical protein
MAVRLATYGRSPTRRVREQVGGLADLATPRLGLGGELSGGCFPLSGGHWNLSVLGQPVAGGGQPTLKINRVESAWRVSHNSEVDLSQGVDMVMWLVRIGGPRIDKFVQQFPGAVCHAEFVGAAPGSNFFVGQLGPSEDCAVELSEKVPAEDVDVHSLGKRCLSVAVGLEHLVPNGQVLGGPISQRRDGGKYVVYLALVGERDPQHGFEFEAWSTARQREPGSQGSATFVGDLVPIARSTTDSFLAGARETESDQTPRFFIDHALGLRPDERHASPPLLRELVAGP